MTQVTGAFGPGTAEHALVAGTLTREDEPPGTASLPVHALAAHALAVQALAGQALPVRRSAWLIVRSLFLLTKPRIIELLLVTALPTMLLADRGVPSIGLIAATLLGGALAAGSANTLNCYIDRDIDAVMKRTRDRPLVARLGGADGADGAHGADGTDGALGAYGGHGEAAGSHAGYHARGANVGTAVRPAEALVSGVALAVGATLLLGLATNWLAAGLADAAILFYVFVYTIGLKRRTASNIVIGGAAGCFPVLVGWAAVTGTVSWWAGLLFAVIFFWTPPHFWALAMKYRDDYAAANVPMLPVIATPATVTRKIIGYSYAMVAVTLLLAPYAGWIYGCCAAGLGAWFLVEAHQLRGRITAGGTAASMRLFHLSIVYLTLLFAAVAVTALLPWPRW